MKSSEIRNHSINDSKTTRRGIRHIALSHGIVEAASHSSTQAVADKNQIGPAETAIVTSGDALTAAYSSRELGGKAYNLFVLASAGFNVPDWFVIMPQAFYRSLPGLDKEEFERLNDESERADLVASIKVERSLSENIQATIKSLGWTNLSLAVRSSSPDEDGGQLSFAGQFASVLNVSCGEIDEAVEKVWQSGFSRQVRAYRWLNGLSTDATPPAVIVQKMVPARLSGVAFGANPLTGATDEITISAVTGYGDKLVSGEVNAASYTMRENRITTRLQEECGRLTARQIKEICHVVIAAGECFGSPQDVEWAVDQSGKLFVLQSRPITTLAASRNDFPTSSQPYNKVSTDLQSHNSFPAYFQRHNDGLACLQRHNLDSTYSQPHHEIDAPNLPDLEERLDIFDNSNIGESYPGITTPLTFSFARKAYQHVYEQFCRLMGVSEQTIGKHAYIFPQMLAMVRGRIYYNLLNWYRLLSLFPGFKTNRRFMEQMMGVKEALPAEFVSDSGAKSTLNERVSDLLAIMILVPRLLVQWLLLPLSIKKFNQRVEKSLSCLPQPVYRLSTDRLARVYRSLEQDLLLKWDAPLVNDFFAMIAFGCLRAVCSKWLPSDEGIHNQLLCGETGIISTEPVRRMEELATIASADSRLLKIICQDWSQSDPSETLSSGGADLVSQLAPYPEFLSALNAYIDKFGDRCTGELKLESPTLKDNPQVLLKAVAAIAKKHATESFTGKNPAGTPSPSSGAEQAKSVRERAERVATFKLKGNPLRYWIFQLILWQARTRIRERENLRFLRTRVFGAVRAILLAMGRQLESNGILLDRQDIFYLETEEIIRFVEGTSSGSDLQALADARKSEFQKYSMMPAPPDRFTARGGVNLNGFESKRSDTHQMQDAHGSTLAADTVCLPGLGCCPGIVEGRARVISDPNSQQLQEGEILIAERTDPGWIMVIAQAKAIAVEYGSLLSHTAIVARELGIPTVVSVSRITKEVNTGDLLRIDGAMGTVKMINHAGADTLQEAGNEQASTGRVAGTSSDTKPVGTACDTDFVDTEINHRARFDFIRYSQCWEDAEIVIEGMNIKPGDSCLSIASAGDNTLAILASDPAKVVALDLNANQLALLELKAAAFRELNYEEMKGLLGYINGFDRLALFEKVKSSLSSSSREFWQQHLNLIDSGVASVGKFERYFKIFRTVVLPLVHSQKTIDELLRAKSREDRFRFYQERWDTPAWRLMFKLFFSKTVMGWLGRDAAFFDYAEGNLPGMLSMLTRRALTDQEPADNPYLHWILKGKFGESLPYFLQERNFAKIKANINKLEIHQLSLEQFLLNCPDRSLDSFNLSDVFEYTSSRSFEKILNLIQAKGRIGARLVYWNMMVKRSSTDARSSQLLSCSDLSNLLFARNKTFFYSNFIVEETKSTAVSLPSSSQPRANGQAA